MRVYEGLFLLDPALASDWPAAEAEINRVLSRAEARLIGLRNWDERKLAYQIGRHKRGLYALSYFEAEPQRIADIERDVQLGEKFLRALIVRKEKMNEEEISKSLAADPPRSSGRYEDRGRWDRREPRSGPPRGRPEARSDQKKADAAEGPAPDAAPKESAVSEGAAVEKPEANQQGEA
ncbi:MAG: 30S ribosomal protein S6 [Phycisphaerae bacterium]